MKKWNHIGVFHALLLAVVIPLPGYAQLVVSDTLTGKSSSYDWQSQGGACLTAGDGTGSIPACAGLPAYSGKTQVGGVTGRLPDPVGQGALRLTNGDTKSGGSNGDNSTGSVVSNATFPTNQGVQVTFSTVTYGGDGLSNGSTNSGADGLAFFLMDGSKPPSVGAFGGSLGYSCSQGKTPADGVDGGYLGVAVDEFGNFSNPGDATSTGPGQTPGAVVVRGSGSITWAALNRLNPTYYPSSLSSTNRNAAVQSTCSTGFLQNWSGRTITDKNNQIIANKAKTTEAVFNYNLLAGPQKLSVPIFNQEGVTKPLRTKANVLTYALSITQDGLLSLSYSANGGAITPVITKQSVIANNGPLPANFRFGFTAGTGSGSNVHEITCFKAAPINTSTSSAGSNVQQTAQVRAGSQVYLSFYHPLNSWGQLTASNFVTDASGNLSIASTANWDANCVLTGGACASTGATTIAQGSAARNIFSWDSTAGSGVDFQFANLTSAQQTAIGGSGSGSTRVAYLRGDRTNELTSAGSGLYRKRDGVLGDIMNSSPVWVGYPLLSYSTPGSDLIRKTSIAEFGTPYSNFVTSNKTRTNVVYTGSNDGMLHGFRAGAYDTSGNFSATTPNDGAEVLAYVPNAVVNSIHTTNTSLDYSSPQYAHNSYVDATPGSGDLFYANAWHTWLVGGLGAGGNSTGVINDATSTTNGVFYALDVTNPSDFSTSSVLGEWDSSSLTCVNATTCKASLGGIYGTPIIRLLHDGNWAVIFGNGRNSSTGTAGVFIMSVNRATGEKTFRFLDTGSKSTTNKNGIDYVSSADFDGDHVADYLYAGDAAGNLWRFDLTSTNPANWAAGAAPLFTTPPGQPISTSVTVSGILPSLGATRVLVAFGTGRQSPQTLTDAATYATGTQSIYGIWDWNFAAWNVISPINFASLSAPQGFTSADLQTQTITNGTSANGLAYRTATQNAVCWKGTNTCTSGNNKYGWKVDLPNSSEQVIFNPLVAFGGFLINTSIPAVTQTLSCNVQPASGFTMAISLETGGAPKTSFFTTAGTNAGIDNSGVVGMGYSGVGTPTIVNLGPGGNGDGNGGNNPPNGGNPIGCVPTQNANIVQQTVLGNGMILKIDPPNVCVGKRLTWSKLR